jgi:hypothetical protein
MTNPGDHEDHTLAGLAVKSFAGRYDRAWWWGYSIQGRDDWRLDQGMLSGKRKLWNSYYETIQRLVASNGNRVCSRQWSDPYSMQSEWSKWGAFSRAVFVAAGRPDPY